MLYRLLKHTCLNCHQFKMGRQEVSNNSLLATPVAANAASTLELWSQVQCPHCITLNIVMLPACCAAQGASLMYSTVVALTTDLVSGGVVISLQMSKFLVKFACLSRGDLVAASLIHTTQAAPSSKALDDIMSSAAMLSKAAADDAAAGDSKGGKGSKGSNKSKQEAAEAELLQHEQQLDADGDLSTGLAAYEAAYGDKGSSKVQQMPKTLHIQDALRTLHKEFYARMPGSKCQNCGCLNPSIKKQGSSKLFKQYSRRALLQNFARGIDVAAAVAGTGAAAAAAMERLREDADAAAEDDEDEKAAAQAGKKRSREADTAGQARKKQGLAGEVKTAVVPAVIKKQQQEQEDWVSSWLSCPFGLCCA
jgi:hypothetical protein